LECTRALFTGRSDESCSGAARFGPPSRGLRASGLPSRELLRFDPPPQRWQHSPPLARRLTPGLRNGRGWTVAPAGDKGHMNVRGSAAPDKQ
jgi:hypothetical protein